MAFSRMRVVFELFPENALTGREDHRAGQDSGMNAQRQVTAPPGRSAEAVTNSLRSEIPRKTVGFFSEPPPVVRWECDSFLTQRILFDTANSSSSLNLSGFPL
jgi:hypothetical protein